MSGLLVTDSAGNVRTNGRGVPRGWNRYSTKGSTYFHRQNSDLALLRRGSKWAVYNMATKVTVSTGSTMVEAVENLPA